MNKTYKHSSASITGVVILALLAVMFLKTPGVVMASTVHTDSLNEATEIIEAQEEVDGDNNQDEVNSENVGIDEVDGDNNQDEVNSENLGIDEVDGDNNQDQVDPGNAGAPQTDGQNNHNDSGQSDNND
jgi:hypothetical protein